MFTLLVESKGICVGNASKNTCERTLVTTRTTDQHGGRTFFLDTDDSDDFDELTYKRMDLMTTNCAEAFTDLSTSWTLFYDDRRDETATVITAVVDAIFGLKDRFIKFPTSDEDRRRATNDFFRVRGFPSVIGCIDGTHIPRRSSVRQQETLSLDQRTGNL
ncbi:hypothetical protein DPMN_027854 [Dreissena polymorpha]|uniref:Nuclease HARBI1 n=1 Tax=Dreissena polymorpha TaxID=45954 RepID=A0A9D4RDU4_DREPO|nr:hypothetical protein DPMN_027854 [Dreissena polymorpha]